MRRGVGVGLANRYQFGLFRITMSPAALRLHLNLCRLWPAGLPAGFAAASLHPRKGS